MSRYIKTLVLALVLTFAFSYGTVVARAQESGDGVGDIVSQLQALLDQIEDLKAQIQTLQTQQQDLRSDLRDAVQLTRSLVRGAEGDDVIAIQELLASDSEIYPEGLITGFYGPLTEQAITRLQEKFGLESVGFVGPRTRAILNKFLAHRIRTGDEPASDRVSFLKRFLTDEDVDAIKDVTDEIEDEFITHRGQGRDKVIVCHMPIENIEVAHTIVIAPQSLSAHLAHGDDLGRCGDDDHEEENDDGNHDMDQDDDNDNDDDNDEQNGEDTVAPVISSVGVNSIKSDEAKIAWTTDEEADSTVWYGTTTPLLVDADDTLSEMDDDMDEDHKIELTDLTPDTTYYFIVGSSDEAGNDAVSDEESFTTLLD